MLIHAWRAYLLTISRVILSSTAKRSWPRLSPTLFAKTCSSTLAWELGTRPSVS